MRSMITILSVLTLGCCAGTNLEAGTNTMTATWYMHGTKTANGERFDPNGMTAAHRTLPFGTKLYLTHKDKNVIVRINDRGPFTRGRQLDLARGAAKALNCPGVCVVNYRIIE